MKLTRQQVDKIREAMQREELDQVDVELDNNGALRMFAVTVRETRRAVPLTKKPRTKTAAV